MKNIPLENTIEEGKLDKWHTLSSDTFTRVAPLPLEAMTEEIKARKNEIEAFAQYLQKAEEEKRKEIKQQNDSMPVLTTVLVGALFVVSIGFIPIFAPIGIGGTILSGVLTISKAMDVLSRDEKINYYLQEIVDKQEKIILEAQRKPKQNEAKKEISFVTLEGNRRASEDKNQSLALQ
jgi:hypothetical protein